VIFPATMADLVRGGYTFQQTTQCRDCRRRVYWFRTPRRREDPFVKNPSGRFVSHFAVCSAVRIRAAEASHPSQGELFPTEVFSSLGP